MKRCGLSWWVIRCNNGFGKYVLFSLICVRGDVAHNDAVKGNLKG